MNAVMYGAGKVGRGFIGALMAKGGYRVTFVDADERLVALINERGRYGLRVVSDGEQRDEVIQPVRALSGRDEAAVIQAIAGCGLMATAVGARALPLIAPALRQGILRRFERDALPLNILVCENLMDAGQVLSGLVKLGLDREQAARVDREIGFVGASIGRMVPLQTEARQAWDQLGVRVEPYAFLPVDLAALRGQPPALPGLVPHSPFDYYLKRKLYLHNMSHALCAYLGLYLGDEALARTVSRPQVELMARAAMGEAALALHLAYRQPMADLLAHVDDLLHRYRNHALGDSNARVGADIPRKLAARDRLVGAADFCLRQGVEPRFITLGAGAALYIHLQSQGQGQKDAAATLAALSGLEANSPLGQLILGHCQALSGGITLDSLYQASRSAQAKRRGPVV